MPTASTSQIMGNNECFEPLTSNLYKRKTLAGEFILVNKYLVDNLWFTGDFNRAEDYNKLEKGKSYDISGYNLRVPVLDMYPKIYKINL